MKKRLIELDALRAFAILIIFFHHADQWSFNFWDLNYFGIPLDLSIFHEKFWGFFGLGLFIFVAGYSIQLSNPELRTLNDVLIFWKKKVIRIFPLYLLGLILFIVLLVSLSVKNILIHVFGLQILLAPKFLEPMPTLWYIGLIIIYYLSYILLSVVSQNNRQFLGFSVGLYLLNFFIHIFFNIFDYRFFLFYFVFISGILFSKFSIQIHIGNKKLLWITLLIFILIISAINVTVFDIPREITTNTLFLHLNMNSMLISFSILVLIFTKLIFLKSKSAPVSQILFIAYSSYVVYLIHVPVWIVLTKIFVPISATGKGLYIVVFGLLLTILLSYSIQRVYDSFVMKIQALYNIY